jgi:hypothetical protein
MGLHLFNREQLLGRDFDEFDLRWARHSFWEGFRGGATSVVGWYRDLFTRTLPQSGGSILIMLVALGLAYGIGYRAASEYSLPVALFEPERLQRALGNELSSFGMLTARGWVWVAWNNLRALGLASLLGTFTFGVAAVVLLMTPVGLVGYFAGNFALAGGDAGRVIGGLVLPHAILEVPAAILAGAAILQLGLAALSLPKGSSLGASWLEALGRWARLNLGLVLPLILAAAAVEVFITPRVAAALLGGVP